MRIRPGEHRLGIRAGLPPPVESGMEELIARPAVTLDGRITKIPLVIGYETRL